MARYRIAVTDFGVDILDVEKSILEPIGCEVIGPANSKDPQQLASLVREADGVLTQFAPVTAAVIEAMQKCRVIVRYGIGVDNVDLKAAAAKGIPVCNVPDYCIDEVADHALAMILDLTRKITANAALVRLGRWGLAGSLDSLHVLRDMTVGVVGFGRIGREVAGRLRGFKCKLVVFDPAVDAGAITAAGATAASFDELLRTSDLVTLHCPSNEKTRYMICAESLAKMKRGAMLVNTSRGTLVKTDDLVTALQSGAISAAALDVTDPEPIPPDHALVRMDNVIINSHIASGSVKASDALRTGAAGIVATACQNGRLPNVVNGVTGPRQ
jgi:D-3-phosphoglycerate dehydrogenase / 2-oxoglutarate reductase